MQAEASVRGELSKLRSLAVSKLQADAAAHADATPAITVPAAAAAPAAAQAVPAPSAVTVHAAVTAQQASTERAGAQEAGAGALLEPVEQLQVGQVARPAAVDQAGTLFRA